MSIFDFELTTNDFKAENNKQYSNHDLIVFVENSSLCDEYYEVAYGHKPEWYNDPVMKKFEDDMFIKNAITLLYNTKNKQKLELLNKILNKCLIFDYEPEFNTDQNQLVWGQYQINSDALPETYREAINFSAIKLENKKANKSYDELVKPETNNNPEIELILDIE